MFSNRVGCVCIELDYLEIFDIWFYQVESVVSSSIVMTTTAICYGVPVDIDS